MSELLTLTNLEVGYNHKPFFAPLNMVVPRGSFWAVLGHNGGGKSTLLRTILGLKSPLGGSVTWSHRTTGESVVVSYLPQRFGMDARVPGRVIDVVRQGFDHDWTFMKPWAWSSRKAQLDEALAMTDLHPLRRQPFSRLSLGQQQRVLLARALVGAPDVLVLDEPTSALDDQHERHTFAWLARWCRERGTAVLVASHHLGLVCRHATHALVVDRDSRTQVAGPMDDVAAQPYFIEHYGTHDHYGHRHTEPGGGVDAGEQVTP